MDNIKISQAILLLYKTNHFQKKNVDDFPPTFYIELIS